MDTVLRGVASKMAGARQTTTPEEGGLAFTELACEDPHLTRRFLEKVFGWQFTSIQMPMGEYLSYRTPDGRGGLRPVQAKEQPSSLAYIRVNDLQAAQVRIEAAGAKIVLKRVDVPGMGAFFWFQVPGGPLLACWQDAATEGPESEEGKP
jgi:uncharacterized protein